MLGTGFNCRNSPTKMTCLDANGLLCLSPLQFHGVSHLLTEICVCLYIPASSQMIVSATFILATQWGIEVDLATTISAGMSAVCREWCEWTVEDLTPSPYTEHEIPLEQTTTTFFPQLRNARTKPLTTYDLPVPAWPERSKLWSATAVFTTCCCSSVKLKQDFCCNIFRYTCWQYKTCRFWCYKSSGGCLIPS